MGCSFVRIEYFNQAVEKDPSYALASQDPRLDSLRADPRMSKLLKRMGLTAVGARDGRPTGGRPAT